jgi:hypothetical protein
VYDELVAELRKVEVGMDGLLLQEEQELAQRERAQDWNQQDAGWRGAQEADEDWPGAGDPGDAESAASRPEEDSQQASAAKPPEGGYDPGAGPGMRREDRPDFQPSGAGDPADDDIVARQLREAAQSETDPTLKEQLWDEYKKYKNSTP